MTPQIAPQVVWETTVFWLITKHVFFVFRTINIFLGGQQAKARYRLRKSPCGEAKQNSEGHAERLARRLLAPGLLPIRSPIAAARGQKKH